VARAVAITNVLELDVSAHIGNVIGRADWAAKWCDAWF
jgi:hypothetical protein